MLKQERWQNDLDKNAKGFAAEALPGGFGGERGGFGGTLRGCHREPAAIFSGVLRKFGILIAALMGSGAPHAQTLSGVPSEPVNVAAPTALAPTDDLPSASDGSILTRRDARTITLKIPAPRGPMVAREVEPLAQNEVAYQVALQFEHLKETSFKALQAEEGTGEETYFEKTPSPPRLRRLRGDRPPRRR